MRPLARPNLAVLALAVLILAASVSLVRSPPSAASPAYRPLRAVAVPLKSQPPLDRPGSTVTAPLAALARQAALEAQRALWDRTIVFWAVWNADWHNRAHYDWDAVAACETGSQWQMTGATFSTGLGIMNAAIAENSPPDAAARELAGTASQAEIVATAESIAARHGIRSWGCWRAALG